MVPEVGQKLGPYEVMGWLAGGGMAGIFRAWDSRLHREVAIKLIRDRAAMAEMRERFLREARVVSGLNHPNICTIFDIGEQDGELYLVMELLEGETLRERIAQGPLPLEEMVRYVREVAEALTLAHSRGVVHRDIKPANIFLANKPNGGKQAKVLDFGLAKQDLDSRAASGMTRAGVTVGTISYMSPEQARGEELDARSDLFSLGVVLYEMATGQLPFKGSTSAVVFLRLLNEEPPRMARKWNPKIPKPLDRVIERLLEKAPKDRYPSAEELVRALAGIALEKRPGWFRKAPPNTVLPREPVTRPKYPPRKPAAAKITTTWVDAEDSSEMPVSLPARRGDLDPVRVQVRPELEERGIRSLSAVAGEADVLDDGGRTVVAPPVTVAADVGGVAVHTEPLPAGWGSSAFCVTDDDFWNDSSEMSVIAAEVAGERARRAADGRGRRWSWVAVALAAGLAGGAVAWNWWGPGAPPEGSVLLLTGMAAPAGQEAVSDAVLEGLEIDLAQSDRFQVRGVEVYEAGQHAVGGAGGPAFEAMRRIASWDGAQEFLAGALGRTAGGGYTVHMELVRTEGVHRQVSITATAESRAQIGAMVDRLAEQIRSAMGEPEESIRGAQVPLANEATANVDALAAYLEGQRAEMRGDADAALQLYSQAVALEPRFTQAQRRLAVLYRARLSALPAAHAAGLGLTAASAASERERLLAESRAALDVEGDTEAGLRRMQQVVDRHPLDAKGVAELAEALRLDGRYAEALEAAQQAYALNQLDVEVNAELERDLLVLDRYDAVGELEKRQQHLGLPPGPDVLLAEYLENRPAELIRRRAAAGGGVGYGVYLDNTGQLRAGGAVWHGEPYGVAAAVRETDQGRTSAAFLAQGALNRALVGACGPASAMLHEALQTPHGAETSFEIGLAAALCGDTAVTEDSLTELGQDWPKNTAVWSFYTPDLRAALALAGGEPLAALAMMQGSQAFEEVSLTPYLRGVAEAALDQPALAAAQFQVVLAHRGAAVLGRSTVYPMAEIGLARALAQMGDTAGSAAAYDRFLELWKDADQDPGPGSALLQEARLRQRLRGKA